MPNKNPKNKIKKDLQKITDTVDLDFVNNALKDANIETLSVSKKTLTNIATWFLDGKSEFEVRQNLELTENEWRYLLKVCPAVLLVMQQSTAYADMVVGGTLFQTAIGGKVIEKEILVKVKDYEYDERTGRSYVIGEHYERETIREVSQPNPYLLKYLSEHKLSEKLGDKKHDSSKEHREVIDSMTEEQIAEFADYNK